MPTWGWFVWGMAAGEFLVVVIMLIMNLWYKR